MSTIVFTLSERKAIHVYIDGFKVRNLGYICSGIRKYATRANGTYNGEEVIAISNKECEIVMLDEPYRYGVLKPKVR